MNKYGVYTKVDCIQTQMCDGIGQGPRRKVSNSTQKEHKNQIWIEGKLNSQLEHTLFERVYFVHFDLGVGALRRRRGRGVRSNLLSLNLYP